VKCGTLKNLLSPVMFTRSSPGGRSQELVCEHEIRNIHCACQDADDLTHFAYITKDHTSKSHYCHVFCVQTMVRDNLATYGFHVLKFYVPLYRRFLMIVDIGSLAGHGGQKPAPWCTDLIEMLTVAHVVKKVPVRMEHKDSLPYSRQLATGPFSELY